MYYSVRSDNFSTIFSSLKCNDVTVAMRAAAVAGKVWTVVGVYSHDIQNVQKHGKCLFLLLSFLDKANYTNPRLMYFLFSPPQNLGSLDVHTCIKFYL